MLTWEQAAAAGKVQLLLTDARGIYLPHDFAQSFVVRESGLDDDMTICATNPDHQYYWEAWENILNEGTIEGADGKIWRLHQDGDLWAIRADVEIDWEAWD